MPKTWLEAPRAELELREGPCPADDLQEVYCVHRKYELYYQCSGTRRLLAGDDVWLLPAGTAVLLGPQVPHKLTAVGEKPAACLQLYFSAESLAPLGAAYPQVDWLGFLAARQVAVLDERRAPQSNAIPNTLRRMLALQRANRPNSALQCQLLLATLLLYLQERCAACRAPHPNTLAGSVQAYIADHYAEPLTLTGLAALYGISPYYLSHAFRQGTGLGLVEAITAARIAAAQTLLAASEGDIAGIARRCGFGTAAHFRRVFKQKTGLSPRQYRRRQTGID